MANSFARSARIGALARAEYEREHAAPIRRTARVVHGLDALVVLTVLAAIEVGRSWGEPAWFAGLAAGAVLCCDVAVRHHPPAWVTSPQAAATGKERTRDALGRLPTGWYVFRDVQTGPGTVDHIVIGPAGVFALETNGEDGEVHVDGDSLWVVGPTGRTRRRGTAAAGQARGNAARVGGVLASAGTRRWVEPVVVIWGDFLAGHAAGCGVTFVHGPALVDWLRARTPARGFDAERVATTLRAALVRGAAAA